jgi:hypothetical protein
MVSSRLGRILACPPGSRRVEMKKFEMFLTTVLIIPRLAHGQDTIIRDVPKNPVRVSTRLQLIASVERASVKQGEPIRLHFHYKNVSTKVVTLRENGWMQDYELTVTDTSGAEPPRTALGQRWLQEQRNGMLLHSGPFVLAPDEEGKDGLIDVGKIYQLNQPGRYFARLMFGSIQRDPTEPKPATIEEAQKMTIEEAVSELIPFTITP